uniref:hypothetical protein n=1 Tax=Sulfitobacter sp. TaxID=1903071 RepID=UPI003F6AE355
GPQLRTGMKNLGKNDICSNFPIRACSCPIGHRGKPIEVFYADGQRHGSQLQHAIQDACVLISPLLQYGATPAAIAKSLSTTPVFGTEQPSSVISVIANDIQCGRLIT